MEKRDEGLSVVTTALWQYQILELFHLGAVTDVIHTHRYINSTDLVLSVLVFANYYMCIYIFFILSIVKRVSANERSKLPLKLRKSKPPTSFLTLCVLACSHAPYYIL